MKKIIFSLLFTLICTCTFAAHIIGGELRYEFVGPGTLPNTKIYKIILLLVKGDATGPNVANLAASYVVGIFNNDDNTKFIGTAIDDNWLIVQDDPPGILSVPLNASPCLTNPPNLVYTYATYSLTVELPDNNNGYTISHQTCCRQTGMANVSPAIPPLTSPGANYTCVVPGAQQLQSIFEIDNCPKFKLPVSVICFNAPFILDFSATDADADSLVYSFCDAYDGGLAQNSGFTDIAPPPYNSLIYEPGFSGSTPLGNLASIDPQTGIISGIAPDAGNYVVCVCVKAYRNGRLLTTHRKDLLVRVSPCIPTVAEPDPGYTTCDGFNIQFSHNSAGANTVFWDFGDPSTLADTSILDNPVYVYADTGIYIVKFIINKGGNCSDSSTITMGVYPGFFPGFEADAPLCAGQPVQFHDTTVTNYGFVDSWSWNFGNNATLADTSHISDPQYTYPLAGTYNATFIVTNSKGCIDTVHKQVIINPIPAISVSNDTTYCGLDTVRLTATGTGIFTWLPSTNIIAANTATPLAFPPAPTTYFATINVAGCKKTDSVRLTPLFNLTSAITANPAAICQEDTVILTGSSNHMPNVSWQWTPAAAVFLPTQRITRSVPLTSTTYTLRTKWGSHCFATSTINVPVTPLAIAQAGPDTAYCTGQAGAPLSASGGNTYLWSPATGLSNPAIPDPIASPVLTTDYIVFVGVNGCIKKRTDTVRVIARPRPPLVVTNDTTICIVDGLQLNAAGNGSVLWTPAYNITNPASHSPFVNPAVDTTYHVRLTDIYHCFRDDSVIVDVKIKTVIDAGPDTSICRTEGFWLRTTGDALHYAWSPFQFMNNDSVKNPFVRPLVNSITYTVIGNIGTCSDTSEVTIITAPYPQAYAGEDTALCIGFNTQLHATGGSSYEWSPATWLSNPSISDPRVTLPAHDIRYIVTVTDTLGCTKAIKDTVFIHVVPLLHVNAGLADTSIVEEQSLSLRATGALTYLWSWTPASLPGWLSGTTIPNPVATPMKSITYIVEGRDIYGCRGTDSIIVTVYNIDPDMYVPTAFTPNGDGTNDIIKPILLGMRSLTYFRVYNRFGQMMYSTSEMGKGWDGVFAGKPQDPATFVWMAEGVTYKGRTKTQKGYVVLIR